MTKWQIVIIVFILLFYCTILGMKYGDHCYAKGVNAGQLLILDKYHRIEVLYISYDSSYTIYNKELDSLIDTDVFFGALLNSVQYPIKVTND